MVEEFDWLLLKPFLDRARVTTCGKRVEIGGHRVRISQTHKCIAINHICVMCGQEASHGVWNGVDLKIYGQHVSGRVLITKDHIIPLNDGGMSSQHNYQTMCVECNHVKGLTPHTGVSHIIKLTTLFTLLLHHYPDCKYDIREFKNNYMKSRYMGKVVHPSFLFLHEYKPLQRRIREHLGIYDSKLCRKVLDRVPLERIKQLEEENEAGIK